MNELLIIAIICGVFLVGYPLFILGCFILYRIFGGKMSIKEYFDKF